MGRRGGGVSVSAFGRKRCWLENMSHAPGMRVSAEINLGSRTVLEYLLSPVQKVAQEAGRER